MTVVMVLKCDEIEELHNNLDYIRKGHTDIDVKALLCQAGRDFDRGAYFNLTCAYIKEKADRCDSGDKAVLVLPDEMVRDILLILDAHYKHTSTFLKRVVQKIRKQVNTYATDSESLF